MIGTILGVIGVILAILSLIYYFKDRKYKRLYLQNVECYHLNDSNKTSLDISLYHKNIKTKNNTFLIKSKIVNNGPKDIDCNDLHNHVLFKTSDSYDWLEVSIINTSKRINASVKKVDNCTIEFIWDLLKEDEEIYFEALAEAKENNNNEEEFVHFYNSLELDYRIKDIHDFERDYLLTREQTKKRANKKMNLIFGILLIFMGIILIPLSHNLYEKPFFEIEYSTTIDSVPRELNNSELNKLIKERYHIYSQNIDSLNMTLEINRINKINELEYFKPIFLIFGIGLIIIGLILAIRRNNYK
jgi:Ca2+/Na+ antiporter